MHFEKYGKTWTMNQDLLNKTKIAWVWRKLVCNFSVLGEIDMSHAWHVPTFHIVDYSKSTRVVVWLHTYKFNALEYICVMSIRLNLIVKYSWKMSLFLNYYVTRSLWLECVWQIDILENCSYKTLTVFLFNSFWFDN